MHKNRYFVKKQPFRVAFLIVYKQGGYPLKKKVKSEGGAKHHSFFSNMYFTLKFCNKHDKWAVLTNLCRSPLILVFDMIVMYFVTALTWCA